jgi:hypothetical protein
MIATVSVARSGGKEDQFLMEARVATAQSRATDLRHGEGDSLLFPELFGVGLDLVHALAGALAVVLLGHGVCSELFLLSGQSLLVSPVDVGC